jgi:hypothetical protein
MPTARGGRAGRQLTKAEFIQHLGSRERYEWEEDETTGAVTVVDHITDPPVVTRLTQEAIQAHDLAFLVGACAGGRDVEQVTRITGYFSKVAGWNRGKSAELRDRHRVTVSFGASKTTP